MIYKNYSLIVIGSSHASQTLIDSFLEKNKKSKILVLEGGSDQETEMNRKLTENTSYGSHDSSYWQNHWVRAYGGTSRKWEGWIGTLEREDFEKNNFRGGWDIDYDSMLPHYKKAYEYYSDESKSYKYEKNLEYFSNHIKFKPIKITKAKRFTDSNKFEKNKQITLEKESNVIKFLTKNRKIISGIEVFKNGKTYIIPIQPEQKIVLAAGSLGNAQILLQPSSTSDIAIGNESGLVGKNLMDHFQTMPSADIIFDEKILKHNVPMDNFYNCFTLSKDIKIENELLNFQASIQQINQTEHMQKSFLDEISLLSAQWNKKLSLGLIHSRGEILPQLHNCIKLTNEKNWVGQNKFRVEFSYSSKDLMSSLNSHRKFGELLVKNKIGMIKIRNDDIFRRSFGTGHIMGTTKLGKNKQDSVCDVNLKHHNYDNLYLLGSSVFPTSGVINPTLTIAALADRLAQRLNGKG